MHAHARALHALHDSLLCIDMLLQLALHQTFKHPIAVAKPSVGLIRKASLTRLPEGPSLAVPPSEDLLKVAPYKQGLFKEGRSKRLDAR